jgi:hydroxylamine dehydrogenase
VALELKQLGFTDVAALKGGFREWVLYQWPIEERGEERKDDCVGCHIEVTPAMVQDWKLSKHSENEVGCAVCHGDRHRSSFDLRETLVQPDRCARCHEIQAQQYSRGKHSKAWEAANALPGFHRLSTHMKEDTKACGGCHRIGTKTKSDMKEQAKDSAGYGNVACNACHTRHIFSKKEALQPQACQTCHIGFDHAQWEMYSSSKHGVRFNLKQTGILPDEASAPSCQSCHMPEGDHGVKTSWGFLGVTFPPVADKTWSDATLLFLRALGIVDEEGNEGPRYEIAKKLDIARFKYDDWLAERIRMLRVCDSCHAQRFGEAEFEKGQQMLRQTDLLVGEAIAIVAGLYKDGLVKKPDGQKQPFPDLLRSNEAPAPVEQRLWLLTMEHRMRAFQGAFHSNPGFPLWSGLNQVEQDLTAIRQMAGDLRQQKRKKSGK